MGGGTDQENSQSHKGKVRGLSLILNSTDYLTKTNYLT